MEASRKTSNAAAKPSAPTAGQAGRTVFDSATEPVGTTIPSGLGLDRDARIFAVIDEVARRRAGGEAWPDDEVAKAHADLMPELAEELEGLRHHAQGHASPSGGSPARPLSPPRRGPDAPPMSQSQSPPVAASAWSGSPNSPDSATESYRRTSSAERRLMAPGDEDDVFSSRLPQIPGYELTREISRGGQAVVFHGKQRATGRQVAIKLLHEGPFVSEPARQRFDREVRILAALSHPHIVAILDRGSNSQGAQYLVMEYIDGRTLGQFLEEHHRLAAKQERPQDPAEALKLFMSIADAVNAAHLRGVVHRDLKPSNILIDVRGEPHILDFGLARSASQQIEKGKALTITGDFLGSLPWASPEQAEGLPDKIDTRTDVYALGVILYQMLTGQFPYEVVGNMRDVLNNIMTAQPAPPSQVLEAKFAKLTQGRTVRRGAGLVNPVIEAIVLKALSKQQEARYQTAGELSRDVANYLSGRPTMAAGVAAAQPWWRPLAPIAAAVAATAISMALLTRDWSGAGTPEPRGVAMQPGREDPWPKTGSPTRNPPAATPGNSLTTMRNPPTATPGISLTSTANPPTAAFAATADFPPMGEATNLLPLIEPQAHRVTGVWTRTPNNALQASAANGPTAIVEAPFQPQGDYSVFVRLSRVDGRPGFVLLFPIAGRSARLLIDAEGKGVNMLDRIEGDAQGASDRTFQVHPRQSHTVEVTVRNLGERVRILASADDKPILDWTGKPEQIKGSDAWRLREGAAIGMGVASPGAARVEEWLIRTGPTLAATTGLAPGNVARALQQPMYVLRPKFPSRHPDDTHAQPVKLKPVDLGDHADLASLNDDFNTPDAWPGTWLNLCDTEKWPVQPYEKVDVGRTKAGWLSILPRPMAWVNDYHGPLHYKNVMGDFIVTARVNCVSRRDPAAPPNSLYGVAGLLIRGPQSPGQWEQGNEGYLFMALGATQEPGKWSLQIMSTAQGDSRIEVFSAPSGSAKLRMVKLGAYFLCMVKYDGDADWRLLARRVRPDLAHAHKQSGLWAGDDWEACERAGLERHNREPILDGKPDLLAQFDYVHHRRPAIPATILAKSQAGQMLTYAELMAIAGDDAGDP